MHLRVAFGLVFVVMVADVVVARPEPLPMYLANRAIKSTGFEVKKTDQNVQRTSAEVRDSADTVPTIKTSDNISQTNKDEISHVETSKSPCVKDHSGDVHATSDLVSSLPVASQTIVDPTELNTPVDSPVASKSDIAAESQAVIDPTELSNPADLPVASKLEDTVGSQIGIDQTEVNSPIDHSPTIGDANLANSEAASVLEGSIPSEDNKDQTALTDKKLLTKKAPKAKKSKKINKVASLNRVRLLDSLIDLLFDSLAPTEENIRRSRRSRAFDEFFDYVFPSSPYEFNYF